MSSTPRSNVRLYFVSLCFVLCLRLVLISPAQAQVAIATDTELGRLLISGSLIKSTHFGSFDVFVGPEVNKWLSGKGKTLKAGGGSSGVGPLVPGTSSAKSRKRPSLFRIILPDGRIPSDLDWRYQSRPGIELALTLEPRGLEWPNGGTTRISAFIQHDFHRVRFVAPSGFGILIDPTTAMVKTNILGYGGEVAIPLINFNTNSARHQLHVGTGVMQYRSTTIAQAQSAFLNLAVSERRERLARFASLTYTYQPHQARSFIGGVKWGGLQLGIQAFQTDHFWTVNAKVASILTF
jgi:hypothetical protein